MVKVFLHGELGRKFGFEHKYNIRTKKQAVRALMGNYSKFRSEILSKTQKGLFYRLVDKRGHVCESETDYEKDSLQEVHLVPSIVGSYDLGDFFGDLFLGTLLIMTGGAIGGMGFAGAGVVGDILFNIGVSIIIGGIQQLLISDPSPQTVESPLETNSYIFQNADNNAVQGFSIPILYGQLRMGSNVITSNTHSVDISKAT